MRIIVDADILAAATALGREDLLHKWQTCPDCGAATEQAYWRPQWDHYEAASYGLVCARCPDRPETPIREWAFAENGKP